MPALADTELREQTLPLVVCLRCNEEIVHVVTCEVALRRDGQRAEVVHHSYVCGCAAYSIPPSWPN